MRQVEQHDTLRNESARDHVLEEQRALQDKVLSNLFAYLVHSLLRKQRIHEIEDLIKLR